MPAYTLPELYSEFHEDRLMMKGGGSHMIKLPIDQFRPYLVRKLVIIINGVLFTHRCSKCIGRFPDAGFLRLCMVRDDLPVSQHTLQSLHRAAPG